MLVRPLPGASFFLTSIRFRTKTNVREHNAHRDAG